MAFMLGGVRLGGGRDPHLHPLRRLELIGSVLDREDESIGFVHTASAPHNKSKKNSTMKRSWE